jgi:AraC family transcriptional regulator
MHAHASVARLDGATVLIGRGREFAAESSAGLLSVKCVLDGAAVWRTGGREFVLRSNAYLVLNDRQPYSIHIDSPAAPATTFCVFFSPGFVEDVSRTLADPVERLLDEPAPAAPIEFTQTMVPFSRAMRVAVARLRAGVDAEDDDPDLVAALAATLVADHRGGAACVDRLGAVKASTRVEVCRRLMRGRDYLLSYQDRRVSLSEAAREACLSPYHFHRAFVAAFATTPHQFIVEQRLLLAASMLAAGSRPVGDVCAATGFASAGSFSTLFRRRFGVSPRAYRASQNRKIGEKAVAPPR